MDRSGKTMGRLLCRRLMLSYSFYPLVGINDEKEEWEREVRDWHCYFASCWWKSDSSSFIRVNR